MKGYTAAEEALDNAPLPDKDCPSCHGTGWATVRVGGITYGGGYCRCVGGLTWAGAQNTERQPS